MTNRLDLPCRNGIPVAALRRPSKRLARQQGAVAVIVAVCLLMIIAFIGMALDTARIYNRRVELQHLANTVALAAAAQLNGTAAGIVSATSTAQTVADSFMYQYNTQAVTWSNSALQFSATPPPDASWTDSTGATASAPRVFYVKVDVSSFGPEVGALETMFMRVLSNLHQTVSVNHVAVAGRTSINVTPLAICALSSARAASRTNPGSTPTVELVEYGFRRGVSYDLMQLNSNGSSGETFVVDPITPANKVATASLTSAAMVSPFVCTGTMWMPHLDGTVTVDRPFPLASLYTRLNSRFNQYDGVCKPNGSPPDYNIKSYAYGSGAAWMATVMSGQSAVTLASDGKLWTIADPSPLPAGNTAPMYGPLWAYARAVPFSAYVAGTAEPAAGYTTFQTSAWSTLYKPGPAVINYPSSGSVNTPYQSLLPNYYTAPSLPNKTFATRNRRVLNIPLLSCPVSGGGPGPASVLGIGRFFMTVPATSTSIYAEFAGALSTTSNGGQVELL